MYTVHNLLACQSRKIIIHFKKIALSTGLLLSSSSSLSLSLSFSLIIIIIIIFSTGPKNNTPVCTSCNPLGSQRHRNHEQATSKHVGKNSQQFILYLFFFQTYRLIISSKYIEGEMDIYLFCNSNCIHVVYNELYGLKITYKMYVHTFLT